MKISKWEFDSLAIQLMQSKDILLAKTSIIG